MNHLVERAKVEFGGLSEVEIVLEEVQIKSKARYEWGVGETSRDFKIVKLTLCVASFLSFESFIDEFAIEISRIIGEEYAVVLERLKQCVE